MESLNQNEVKLHPDDARPNISVLHYITPTKFLNIFVPKGVFFPPVLILQQFACGWLWLKSAFWWCESEQNPFFIVFCACDRANTRTKNINASYSADCVLIHISYLPIYANILYIWSYYVSLFFHHKCQKWELYICKPFIQYTNQW